MEFQIDMKGALHKTATLLALPKAQKHILAQFLNDKVQMLKRRAASMQKTVRNKGTKSAQMSRNIDYTMKGSPELTVATIGTGVGKANHVKYADIQDKGGPVRAKKANFTIQNIKGKPTFGPYLTVPLPGTRGSMKDYKGSFVIRTKSGKLLVVQGKGKGGGFRPLFVLKYEVNIPASHWFSGIMDGSEEELMKLMSAEHQLKTAEGMAREGGV